MASNLFKKTEGKFVIYDVFQDSTSRFVNEHDKENARVKVASDPSSLAKQSSTIITMLPASPQVKEVFTGEGGLLNGLQAGSLVIDSSTIDQSVAVEMSELTKSSGGVHLDAPVSGGVVGAQAATLTFMVGGEEGSFAKAEPVLAKMGKNIVDCGKPGNGQVIKICNNMLLGITMLATSEAMALGARLGADPELLARIINTSSGRSWSSEVNNPHPNIIPTAPSSRNYDGGFGVSLMAKDMKLALTAASQSGSTIVLGSVASQVYNQVSKTESYGKKDFSVVYKWLCEFGQKFK